MSRAPGVIVEGRHFPYEHALFGVVFAQRLADEYEREVVVYERSPGGAKFTRDRVKPHYRNGDSL